VNRRQKQEVIMNDNVTVLHDQSKLALRPFAPEFTIRQPTGYAVTEDGMQCVLRTVTAEGHELLLIIPTVQIEATIGALRAAKLAAAAKTVVEEGKTAVFTPKRYETIRVENFDGVLLAFDRGEESEIVVGLDSDAAIRLGQDLRKQGKATMKLILPTRFGTSERDQP
jgi:hypothetical protein